MEPQSMPTQQQYRASSDTKQRPSRTEPNYQSPSTLPSQDNEQSPLTNGMARTTSRRRKPSGSGQPPRIQIESFPQPPAPEVPKAPPVSYRPPYSAENYGPPRDNYSASFAERARALTGNSIPTQPSEPSPKSASQPAKPVRRGSLNRPIGGVYSEIQQHKRDSYPPPDRPVSPRRFSNPTSPRQYQAPDPDSSTQEISSAINQSPSVDTQSPQPRQPRTDSRRASAGVAQPARKDWAPDRSPLQKLEVKLNDISKEEKRARVQEAEQRLRDSRAGDKRRSSGREGDSAVERTSTGQVSANTGSTRPRGPRQYPERSLAPADPKEQPQVDKHHPPPEPRLRETNQIPRSDRRRESLLTDSYPHRAPERIPQSENQLIRDRSRRNSTRPAEMSQAVQQPERGVRFQGQDGAEDGGAYPTDAKVLGTSDRRRSPGTEALARSDEALNSRREKGQNTPTITNHSSSKDVPIQQQNLYSSKAQTSRNDASAATYGGAADPAPRQAVQSQRQAQKYEIPPQTASGIQARHAVGFSGEPQGAVEAPGHRKHHLSNYLHRGHNHAADTHDPNDAGPRHLDEWRRAGTARLTAADFGSENDSDKEQNAWWEGGRSGSKRKSGRASIRDTKSLQGGYQNGTGKSISPFKYQELRRGKSEATFPRARSIHTRPYVGEAELNRLEDRTDRLLESPLSHFLHRSGHDQTRGLSSAYSYSCPDLAIHDPSHASHICKPYLSKELIQSMRSIRIRPAPELATFNPPLYLKCGPLLRYTGMKRDKLQMKARSGGPASMERETWRGSVMIVTADADSSYDPAPTLRLFSEPMDVLPPPPQHVDTEDAQDLPSEYIDPIAGLPKLSRSGKTVYVKPVDDLEHAKDLSRLEDDDGLFEETRTAAVPTAYGTPDFRASSANPKPIRRENKASEKGQRVRGVRLHAERGVTFWRFNLEVELGAEQTRIAYSINNSPSVGFWVPARGHTMNVMFHSCNGFSMSVSPDAFSGPDPMWRDVLNSHQTRPFHVMIGGGDQIYNDAVMRQSPLLEDWLGMKNPHQKHEAAFTSSLREELETVYLERYSMWFSQGLFGMANSQIPMVNMWDDHDIIDGFGSYPHHFMSTPIFCGLGAVAFKYYMLFQHQSVPDEGSNDEPSWLMGGGPGPYITELSRSIFLSLGKNVALLALDCRTERMREEILSEATYEIIFERCRREILEGETKHVIVLLGVPIAYPRLVWLENLLTSRVMDPVKALGRAGMLKGFLNKFDGGVEILDDLDDHWTAKNHKHERNWFVQELQELAAEKSVRVTILGGDVHLAAVGQFFSNPKLGIPKDKDHRYMANIVSSAIVNTPPPNNMADILNRRNKTHHLDHDTDEDMIPMFTHDVNGNSRNNKHLLPRRNWCSIREYHPGSTPPPTPPLSEPETESDESPPPPSRLQRTLSLTRGEVKPGNLLRRLSGRGPPPSNGYPPGDRYGSGDPPSPDSPQNDGYFPAQPRVPQRAATVNGNGGQRHSSAPLPNGSAPLPRPGNFHRRPTNLSEKAATKGDPDDTSSHINLEHGLDVVLNCEVNQRDPAGITVPYRLLIPALFYEGHGDLNTESYSKKGLVSRLTSIRGRRRKTLAGGQGQGNYGQQESVTPSESEGEEEMVQPQPRRFSFGITQRRQYRDQTPPLEREIGEEGTQQQRQFEHRSQQIGQTQQQRPFIMPPRQQRLYSDLQTPTEEYDPQRGDSIDYHQHLDSSPPGGTGYLGRRPSKVDRVFGVMNLHRSSSASAANRNMLRSNSAGTDGQNFASAEAPGRPSYDSEDGEEYQDDKPQQGKRISQGYSGIEAYSEKKGWKKWLSKAKQWEEQSSGRR